MDEQESSRFRRWIASAVGRYEGRLLRYAARMAGDTERARDAVQDTFMRLCRQDRTELDGRLAEWLFTVCRNRVFDIRRKENRMISLSTEQALSCESPEPGQDVQAERDDLALRVRRLLDEMPPKQQEVVRLKFQEGLSYRDISRITGHSESNVGYLIHTAVKKLRDQMVEST